MPFALDPIAKAMGILQEWMQYGDVDSDPPQAPYEETFSTGDRPPGQRRLPPMKPAVLREPSPDENTLWSLINQGRWDFDPAKKAFTQPPPGLTPTNDAGRMGGTITPPPTMPQSEGLQQMLAEFNRRKGDYSQSGPASLAEAPSKGLTGHLFPETQSAVQGMPDMADRDKSQILAELLNWLNPSGKGAGVAVPAMVHWGRTKFPKAFAYRGEDTGRSAATIIDTILQAVGEGKAVNTEMRIPTSIITPSVFGTGPKEGLLYDVRPGNLEHLAGADMWSKKATHKSIFQSRPPQYMDELDDTLTFTDKLTPGEQFQEFFSTLMKQIEADTSKSTVPESIKQKYIEDLNYWAPFVQKDLEKAGPNQKNLGASVDFFTENLHNLYSPSSDIAKQLKGILTAASPSPSPSLGPDLGAQFQEFFSTLMKQIEADFPQGLGGATTPLKGLKHWGEKLEKQLVDFPGNPGAPGDEFADFLYKFYPPDSAIGHKFDDTFTPLMLEDDVKYSFGSLPDLQFWTPPNISLEANRDVGNFLLKPKDPFKRMFDYQLSRASRPDLKKSRGYYNEALPLLDVTKDLRGVRVDPERPSEPLLKLLQRHNIPPVVLPIPNMEMIVKALRGNPQAGKWIEQYFPNIGNAMTSSEIPRIFGDAPRFYRRQHGDPQYEAFIKGWTDGLE